MKIIIKKKKKNKPREGGKKMLPCELLTLDIGQIQMFLRIITSTEHKYRWRH